MILYYHPSHLQQSIFLCLSFCSKVRGTPIHPPTLCIGERVPWKTKNRSAAITMSGNSKHTPDFKTASIMFQGFIASLIFFPAGRLQDPCLFSAPTLGLILSYNSLGLDKLFKFTFYGECWNVPSLFYSYKTKVGRERWPVFPDLPPHLASEFSEDFPVPASPTKPWKKFQRPIGTSKCLSKSHFCSGLLAGVLLVSI